MMQALQNDSSQGSAPFRTLGAFRALALQHVHKAYFSDSNEEDSVLKELGHFVNAAGVVAHSVGLPLTASDIVPTKFAHIDEMSEFFIANTLTSDVLHKRIHEHFGAKAAFNFHVAQLIAISGVLAAMFSLMSAGMAPRHRRAKIAAERARAIAACEVFGEALLEQSAAIRHEFGLEFWEATRILARAMAPQRWSRKRFAAVYELSQKPLNALVPQYSDIEERRARASDLLESLASCPSGRQNWQKYEEICIKALRFLFVPPFRKVEIQARTEDGHERRDGILPNNQFLGFWSLVRGEFDCRHVVCEFKNNTEPFEKEDLNQLRIYLSKPTIGRFGLLFHRGEPSASGLQARRNSYEQSRILVLLVDDAVLRRLLDARVYLGSADAVLEDLKSDFEVRY